MGPARVGFAANISERPLCKRNQARTENKIFTNFWNHYPRRRRRRRAAAKIYDCKRRRCETNSGAISTRRKRSRKYFMFTRRKIFLPVNYPVNMYARPGGSDSLSRVCVMSRMSRLGRYRIRVRPFLSRV